MNFSKLDRRRESARKDEEKADVYERMGLEKKLGFNSKAVMWSAAKILSDAFSPLPTTPFGIELQEVSESIEVNDEFWMNAFVTLEREGVLQDLWGNGQRKAFAIVATLLPVPENGNYKAHDGIILYLVRSGLLSEDGKELCVQMAAGGLVDHGVALKRYFKELAKYGRELTAFPGIEHDHVPEGTREDIYGDKDDWANEERHDITVSTDDEIEVLIQAVHEMEIEKRDALAMLSKLNINQERKDDAAHRLSRTYADYDRLIDEDQLQEADTTARRFYV